LKIPTLAVGLLCTATFAGAPLASEQTDSAFVSAAEGLAVANQPVQRWYSFQHVVNGGRVFQQHCAACHGKLGEGAPNWQQVGADGKYPAPPLNGTGHAWHHPLKALFYVIKNGSPGGQGSMPGWRDKISDDDIVSVIAWFQSKWTDQIYAAWRQQEGG